MRKTADARCDVVKAPNRPDELRSVIGVTKATLITLLNSILIRTVCLGPKIVPRTD